MISTNKLAKTREYVNFPKSSRDKNLAKINIKKNPETSLLIVVIVEYFIFFLITVLIIILIYGVQNTPNIINA